MPSDMAITEGTQEKLMEQIRKNNSKVRSFDEFAQLLHMISSEQKGRKMLQLCTDKVLINMSDIHSLRDIIERLRSVARTNGLLFNLVLDKNSMGSEASCRISGEIFFVEIVLDGKDNELTGPAVLDVKISYSYSKHVKSCPELVEIIRNGRFLDLSKHLKALINLYPMSVDRQTKTKVYMALQSLETDVNKMSQLYMDSHKDADDLCVAMHGLVGLLSPRVMGMCFQLRYFFTPYELLDLNTGSIETNLDQLDENKGLLAEIRIKSHDTPCSLPITPLISNNHPVSGSGKPRFPDVNQHNAVSLPACFVLKLKPKVLLVQQIATEIEKETGMTLFGKEADIQSYLKLLKKEKEEQEVIFDLHKQIYNLNLKHLKASFVSEILFTHPAHLVAILNALRKQAYLNNLFGSCIRPKKTTDKDLTVWHYDVTLESNMEDLRLTFQHPLSPNSTAFAEIVLDGDGFSSCRLFSGRSDPAFCSDQYALTILQKSFSLPILMRAIILQTKKSPRKEPDRNRSSRQSIYQHRATSTIAKKPAPPPQQAPAIQNQPKRPPSGIPSSPAQTTAVSSAPMFQAAFKPTTNAAAPGVVADQAKKESQHPMLTQLLKPQSQAQNTVVPPKSHPMLLGLLKENEASKGMPQQQLPQQTQMGQLPQRQSFQQQGDPSQHPTPPFPQYASSPQLTLPFGQQMTQSQDQMPPPSSYYSGQQKPVQQQQYQSQQQVPNYSNPSPLSFDDLGSGPPSIPQLPSPYNAQPSASHSTTPPLFSMIPSPLASPSSQTSPMTFTASPRQPPMNTPQPLPMTSPRHAAMTPPMLSPAPRKVPVARRGSRQKSRSIDQSGFDTRSDVMGDIGFPSSFDMITESDNQLMDMQDVFSAGLSPAQGQQSSHQALPSPAISSARSQRHLSGDRAFNFSFESDLLDSDPQRRTSFGRRTSNQPFMTPSPALSTQESQDTAFPMPSPASSVDNFQPSSFAVADTKPSLSDIHQASFGGKPSEIQTSADGQLDNKNFSNKIAQPDQMESDPFNFDDNKTPQKISMPDSMSDQKTRPGISSRSSSISSNSGAEETSLKSLLAGAGNAPLTKIAKAEKLSTNQSGKATVGQRRGSVDYVAAGSRPGSEGGTTTASSHKPLVRQNALGKGGISKFQSLQNEAKEKSKKKSVKDEKGSANYQPRRRGRPPSTDKKEHLVKRKKTEGFGEDSEQRGKIVLNVQLNKGTPISSTTKTKPVPADPPAEKTPSSGSSNARTPAPAPASAVDPHNLDALQHDSPDLIKQYFRNQGEQQEKKKKEKKFGSGTSSPMPSMNKNSIKSAQTGSGLNLMKSTSGTASGTAKLSSLPHQKSGPAASMSKVGYRPRKGSINQVNDALRARAESAQTPPGSAPEKRPVTGLNTAKSTERSVASDQAATTVKLKGVPPPSGTNKFTQSSKLIVSKTPGGGERTVAVKPSGAPKTAQQNKSPGSHTSKQLVGANRPPVQTKRDRPRPVTPIRDAKVTGATPSLKSQPSGPVVSNKSDKSSKAIEGFNSLPKAAVQSTDSTKRPIPNRPPSANKSPRSVTPPQARFPPQGGVPQSKTERMQSMLGKRSPGQAVELIRPDSTGSKRPSFQEPPFQPPQMKKLAVPSDSGAPRASPRSPDDRLIIDDGSDDVISVPSQGSRTETPPIPQPPPLTHGNVMNPYVSMPTLPSDFSASPSVSCELDDDLMNAAVS